jgi:hypothetical protein
MTEASSVPHAPASDAAGADPTVLPLRLAPPPPDGAIVGPPEHQEQRSRWFFAQLAADLRLAARMYFDPRYRVSRLAQCAFPLIGALMVLNYFLFVHWFAWPVFSPIVERLLDVLLAVVAYRMLARELERYRAVLDYLTRYGSR